MAGRIAARTDLAALDLRLDSWLTWRIFIVCLAFIAGVVVLVGWMLSAKATWEFFTRAVAMH